MHPVPWVFLVLNLLLWNLAISFLFKKISVTFFDFKCPPFIRTFFAPNQTYDKNTFIALKKCGINQVLDGYGLMPYIENEIKFVPQLFEKVALLPFGIQSTKLHLNEWKEKDFENFEKFIDKNSKKIISYEQALQKINNNLFYKFINVLSKKILRFKRIGINKEVGYNV